jgi:hypothetical protein
MGLGFAPGSAKFQVDCIRVKGWRGQCEKCRATILAWTSRRHVTRFPKKINQKIQSAKRA